MEKISFRPEDPIGCVDVMHVPINKIMLQHSQKAKK